MEILTQAKATVLEVKRKLRAVPPNSAGPVLALIDENGQVLLTLTEFWNRASKGRRNFENQIEFEFKVADLADELAPQMAQVKQLREYQGPTDTPTAETIFQRKRVVRPKVGEARIWLLYGIEADFAADAKFHAP